MGLRKKYIDFILNNIDNSKKMCELGNQKIRDNVGADTGKNYFSEIGFDHTSIDWNGKDNALNIDLSLPIQNEDLLKSFDVITNAGTSEHVKDQYNCFRNIHNLVKSKGYIVHIVPLVGYWWEHSKYHYTFDFFRELANLNDYSIIKEEIFTKNKNKKKLVGIVLNKQQDNEFIDETKFYKGGIYFAHPLYGLFYKGV